MIDKLIEQELVKFDADSYEIEEKVIEDDSIVYLLPNQFALITYFQVRSNDSVFQIDVFSDDLKTVYTENNCRPLQDPLNSRYFASSDRFTINRGFLQTQKKEGTENYFLYYYLVNIYADRS